MFKENVKSIGILTIIILVIYAVHRSLFRFFNYTDTNFIYTLEQLYLFFGLFSIVIELILIRVKQKNIDIVGNVFLLITLIKMMVCYVLGSSILKLGSENNSIQKWNFLILFLIFLAIETAVTISMLNKKED